ncbi:hypothetical protein Zmor_010781 [Zophobas morio]|uniref:THAP-type domain-containing protein n=1 Tax=Zophobas morio TaxID=2755281 RepID=A0AA38IPA1_9CUCU|nr:hypothetical protein Zmor_010781 [Zophobas morio]
MERRGGTACIVRGCSSRTCTKTLSFFRIPKNPEKDASWLNMCNRQDLLPSMNLYKNYRLCELHFEPKWYSLGCDVRKRLLSNAVPTIFPHLKRLLEDKVATEEPPQKIIFHSDVTSGEVTKQSDKPSTSDELLYSIELPDSGLSKKFEDQRELSSVCEPQHVGEPTTSAVGTQTSSLLSASTPRKTKLRETVKKLRRQLTTASQPVAIQDNHKYNPEDFESMCNKFLSKPLAEIVKVQVKLQGRSVYGRRYSAQFKEIALTIYFLGPRVYRFMSKILYLPSKRTLENMTAKIVCNPGLKNEAIFKALQLKVDTIWYVENASNRSNSKRAEFFHSYLWERRFILFLLVWEVSSRRALPSYMTLVSHKETLLTRSIVGSLGPGPARCMTSQRREPTCYRTTKFSSTNRHRKLQPFRET